MGVPPAGKQHQIGIPLKTENRKPITEKETKSMTQSTLQPSPLSPTGREIFVSPSGSDLADGTAESPVSTLYRAAELARARGSGGTTPVTVRVAAGKYVMATPLMLTEADSGVHWMAEGEVILTGAIPLTGLKWSHYTESPAIRVAQTEAGLSVDRLFIDGVPQIMARYPNYNARQPLQGCTTRSDVKTRSESWKNPAGGYLRALHSHKWGGNSYTVVGKGSGPLGLELRWVGDNNRGSDMHPDCVMVENILEELDAPGEWYYDREDGKLYVMPAEGMVLNEDTLVEGAVATELIHIRGVQDGAPATDITFDGFTLENTARTLFTGSYVPLMRGDWCVVRSGALFLQDAENITFRNGCIRHIGGNGVFISGHCEGILIHNNEILHIGSSGVLVAGLPDSCREPSFWEYSSPLKPEVNTASIHKTTVEDLTAGPAAEHYPRGCTISHNHVKDVGMWEKQSSQVAISVAAGIRVLHNTLHEGPRAAVNVNDGTFGGHEIAYNDVFDVQRETDDHGMFNSWGRDRFWSLGGFDTMGNGGAAKEPLSRLDCVEPIRIHDNRFHFGGRVDGGSTFGIDLDDGSSNYRIYNNLCLNMGVKLREGFHREVYNNIFVNGTIHLHCTYENSCDRIRGNIVIGGAPYALAATDEGRFRCSGNRIDGNWFYGGGLAVSLPTFWFGVGYDRNSVIGEADPAFRDPSVNDYTVENRVVASRIGFVNFSMTQFGKPGCADVCPVCKNSRVDGREDGLQREIWLGATVSALDDAIMSATAAGSLKGVYLENVPRGSLAAACGLQTGDVIRWVGDVELVEKDEFLSLYEALQEGDTVRLRVLRSSRVTELSFIKGRA